MAKAYEKVIRTTGKVSLLQRFSRRDAVARSARASSKIKPLPVLSSCELYDDELVKTFIF